MHPRAPPGPPLRGPSRDQVSVIAAAGEWCSWIAASPRGLGPGVVLGAGEEAAPQPDDVTALLEHTGPVRQPAGIRDPPEEVVVRVGDGAAGGLVAGDEQAGEAGAARTG